MRLPQCKYCFYSVLDKENESYLCFKNRENPKIIWGSQSNMKCFQLGNELVSLVLYE